MKNQQGFSKSLEESEKKLAALDEQSNSIRHEIRDLINQFRNMPNSSLIYKIKDDLFKTSILIDSDILLEDQKRKINSSKGDENVNWINLINQTRKWAKDLPYNKYNKHDIEKSLYSLASSQITYTDNLQSTINKLNEYMTSQLQDYDNANKLQVEDYKLPNLESMLKKMLELSQQYDCICSEMLGRNIVNLDCKEKQEPDNDYFTSEKLYSRTMINSIFFSDKKNKISNVSNTFKGSLIEQLIDNSDMEPSINFEDNLTLSTMLRQRNEQTYDMMFKSFSKGVLQTCKELHIQPENLGINPDELAKDEESNTPRISLKSIKLFLKDRFRGDR